MTRTQERPPAGDRRAQETTGGYVDTSLRDAAVGYAPVVPAYPHRISYRRCATPGCSGWRPVVPPGCAAGWDRCAECWRRARAGVAA